MNSPRLLLSGLAVSAAFAAALVSCGRAEPPAKPAGFRVALLTPGPISDAGWNAGAYEGLKAIEKELGASVSHV
ncbi:MAG: BMP family ABC transporter substrate-binding protein, partial [Acidobacteriota bacterium]|nr:BMP family ABC transporter substrate-binding protein [Acidobacteriota bacterium]